MEEEELRKAHDELEKRVEERTTELQTARERLRYLMTVTPAIVYTNQASDYTCTFVTAKTSPVLWASPLGRCLKTRIFGPSVFHPHHPTRVFGEMAPLVERGGGRIRNTASAIATATTSEFKTRSGSSTTRKDVRRKLSARGRISPIAKGRRMLSVNAWPL